MTDNNLTDTVSNINKSVGKFYDFHETHNPNFPADYWFQNPKEGLALFLVMYTRTCRWSKCLGCSLPSLESQFDVPFFHIMKQVDYIFDFLLTEKEKQNIRKIILSNNGSVLDEVTFSTTALLYFVAKMNINCPNVSVLTLETRPEYVDIAELEVLHRALKEGATPTNLELAIGFEAFDEHIRNEIFNKGMSLQTFEAMVQKMAGYGFQLKTYFMQKPVPGLSEEEGVHDILAGIDYLDGIAKKYNILINMHLNPTYVAKGTALETEFKKGNYQPPRLQSVKQAVLGAEGKHISLYVGLNDEGLAVPGGSFLRQEEKNLQEKLELFNQTGDFSILKNES